jgi:hypothetical protein
MARGKHAVSERSQPPTGEPPLSPLRAFVVQFRAGSAPWAGRVEHIVSGRATRFDSAEALEAFLTQVLIDVERQSS